MDTYLNFLLPRSNNLTTSGSQTTWMPFLVSTRSQAIRPTSSTCRALGPILLSQFDFALCETPGTHMSTTYWLGPTTSWCPSSYVINHTWKSKLFECTLVRVLEWSSNLTIHFKEPLALPTYLKVKQFDFSLFKLLVTRYDWGQQFDHDTALHFESINLIARLMPSALAPAQVFSLVEHKQRHCWVPNRTESWLKNW